MWHFKGQFTHSMPCPCRAHAVPLPCRAANGLECVFPIWFTQCSHVLFTLTMPCSDHAILLKAMAQHVRRETACGLPACVWLLPATTWSSMKVVTRSIPISDAGGQCEIKQHLSCTRKRVVAAYYKKDHLLNCRTSNSVISSYNTDFHKGHGTIRAWQGNSMGTACYVWIGLIAALPCSGLVFTPVP